MMYNYSNLGKEWLIEIIENPQIIMTWLVVVNLTIIAILLRKKLSNI